MPKSDHIAQQKILRVFQLIQHLKRPPHKTKKQLADRLGCGVKTVGRYFMLLEELGFFIDEKYDRYFLAEEKEDGKIYFTAEEVATLQGIVRALPPHHPLREPIAQKLFFHSELLPISELLVNQKITTIIKLLDEAIQAKLQVQLRNYHSLNSGTVGDRLLEPLLFTDDFQMFQAYEPSTQKVKVFHTQRIEEVEATSIPQQYKGKPYEFDLYGFISGELMPIKLRLSDKAYHLMVEDRPKAKAYITATENGYIFQCAVRSWKGIGRFVAGLFQEVEILEGEGFEAYLRNRMGKE